MIVVAADASAHCPRSTRWRSSIQVSIAIIIKKSASRPPAHVAFIGQSHLLGNIGKSAVPIVTVENILAVISDEDILESIVVVVPDRYSAGPPRPHQPGLLRNIGERTIPVILVEAITRPGNRFVHPSAAQHENIQPSVVVKIQEGNAATHRFDDVVFMF